MTGNKEIRPIVIYNADVQKQLEEFCEWMERTRLTAENKYQSEWEKKDG